LAIGIREALGVNPTLEQVVDAMRCIARTLGGLADQKISHRDIKPENLYCHKGQWVVGDFGLVDYPGKEAVTVRGRALGPRFYLAPEMITDPVHADGRPADVYSLAKTLWVLGAGQNYPPPGFQPASISQNSLNMYVGHPHADILDRLIERATRHSPTERPTMGMMADELDAWSEMAQRVSEVGRPMPFLPMLKKHLDEESERLDSIRRRGEEIYEKEIKNHIKGFVEVLKDSGLSRLSDTIYHNIETDELLGRLHCISFETRGIKKYVMRIYLGLAVCKDLLTLRTKSSVELHAPSGENLLYWKDEQPVEIESSFVEQKLAGVANECAGKIEAALIKLLECLKRQT
jgi:serine/threonine protein kinase